MKQIKLKVNHLVRGLGVTYIKQYLNTLGISKIESFINQPDEQDEEDPMHLDHITAAAKITYEALSRGEKVFVQVD